MWTLRVIKPPPKDWDGEQLLKKLEFEKNEGCGNGMGSFPHHISNILSHLLSDYYPNMQISLNTLQV